jgi:hypothetical protein
VSRSVPQVRGGDINLIGEVLLTNKVYASRPDFNILLQLIYLLTILPV